jgi:UDP-N-acetylglucosamine 2-epimerase (non-hydrolysing)
VLTVPRTVVPSSSETVGAEQATVLVVVGTRPEAIKLAPVVRELKAHPRLRPLIVSTGQHREMLDQTLRSLGMTPDHDLHLMRDRQLLSDLTARVIASMGKLLRSTQPSAVVVQGDTTSAFCAAFTAAYEHIPVGHVEAGLRSGDPENPFPEELNRRMITVTARWHFAPTRRAQDALLREGVRPDWVQVTGNTVVDNLLWVLRRGLGRSAFRASRSRVLVTLHRRESHGAIMQGIARALADIARLGDVEIVLPLHKSPAVHDVLVPVLRTTPHVHLVEPLDYFDFIATLADSDLILTDSGGVQEEAPSLGKPVLVLRKTTERREAIECGAAKLVGVDPGTIVREARRLLARAGDPGRLTPANPFGDGHAAPRIVAALADTIFDRHAMRGSHTPELETDQALNG